MTLTPNDYERGINDGYREGAAVMKERCAQVAEKLHGPQSEVAAAIRAMKDQS